MPNETNDGDTDRLGESAATPAEPAHTMPPNIQKRRWRLGRLSERTINIIGVVSFVLGIGSMAFAIYALWLSLKPEIAMPALYTSLAIFGTVALLSNIVLIIEVISTERIAQSALLEAVKATASAAQMSARVGELERRPEVIATEFRAAARAISDYETTVDAFVEAVQNAHHAHEIENLYKKWDDVISLLSDALDSICNAAATAIALNKGRALTSCSANIKLLEGGEKDLSYRVIGVSKTRGPDRADKDKKEPRLVEKHAIYHRLLMTKEPIVIPDIADEVKWRGAAYNHPSNDVLDDGDYKSCMLMPVLITKTTLDDPNIKEENLYAILCADSNELNYFDSRYPTDVMKQLACHVLTCGRIRIAALNARDRLLRKRSA